MKKLVKEDLGGVSAPMSTPFNTPGVGNAQPASMAAMTGAQQTSPNALGSGDKWGNSLGNNLYTQNGSTKKKKKKRKKRTKKHKIKKLESFLSQYIKNINEKELERDDILLDEIELVKYNKLTKEQKEEVKAIAAEDSPYMNFNQKTLSRGEQKILQVALYDDTVLGYFAPDLNKQTDTWDIAPIKTAKKYKNLGIAKKLMEDFFEDKSGYIYIYDANKASIKVFTSIGFKKDRKDTQADGWWYRKD
jgi:transcriptional regulator of heat shock response